MKKLERDFFNRDALTVAQELLGKILIRKIDGEIISVKIVETEAYMGIIDKAAHSYDGKRTPRIEVMYGQAGHAYVFMIYGIHYCFNVVTQQIGIPQAVLIRAVEPMEGMEIIAENRFQKNYCKLTKKQIIGLTNGPGKLCKALQIDKKINGEDLCGNSIYIAEGLSEEFIITASKRVGIDYAEEAKDFLWRFYIEGNPWVSLVDGQK